MKFKLDENLNESFALVLRGAGHDVRTVVDQNLGGSADPRVFTVCQDEQRCLVTFDLGFANLLTYRPEQSAGIIVLRVPKPTFAGIQLLAKQLCDALQGQSPAGQLWIIEPGRLRIREIP